MIVLAHMRNPFVAVVPRNVARLWKHMVEYDDRDQRHHYVCVGIRASDAEFIDLLTQVSPASPVT